MYNFFSIILIYPAMIGLDVKRREDQRYDIFCCVRRYSDFSALTSLRIISDNPTIAKKLLIKRVG